MMVGIRIRNSSIDEVCDVKITPDCNLIISIGGLIDKTIKIWKLTGTECKPEYVFRDNISKL